MSKNLKESVLCPHCGSDTITLAMMSGSDISSAVNAGVFIYNLSTFSSLDIKTL